MSKTWQFFGWTPLLAGAVMLTVGAIANPADAQTRFRPIAVVNDSAITGFDLAQRAQLMVTLGFQAASPDALRAEALDQLVQDRLKLQAGRQIGITPDDQYLEEGLGQIARSQDITVPELQALMSAQGVTKMALDDFATAQSIWGQVVRARFASRIQPGEGEIDAEMGILQGNEAFQYKILEIGLPLNSRGRSEADTRALAEQLYDALNNGGKFADAVAQYSEAPSAARGGDVGWVTTQRMPPDLQRALGSMEVGQVSRPLSVPGGLSLLKLLDKRSSGSSPSDDVELRERVRQQLVRRKSARLAEGLLQELRRDALIDVR
ncbi:MAG: peptidylprolyl isomerase [Pseudomonadota bacterium]